MAGGSRRAARRAAARAALRRGEGAALRRGEGAATSGGGRSTVEDGWVVRRLSGAAASAGKGYRCPGCDQELPAGTPHVVAWPEGRPDERRHWHTPCWEARSRRGVKVHRSKNAPRY